MQMQAPTVKNQDVGTTTWIVLRKAILPSAMEVTTLDFPLTPSMKVVSLLFLILFQYLLITLLSSSLGDEGVSQDFELNENS